MPIFFYFQIYIKQILKKFIAPNLCQTYAFWAYYLFFGTIPEGDFPGYHLAPLIAPTL